MNWKFWQKNKKKKNADNKVKEQPIVIPEPTREVLEFKGNIDNHNKFNVLLDVDGDMFRIKDEQSHEVVRMVCKCYDRKIKSISVGGSYLYYAHSISESSFIRRLFATDNGHFFYQNIISDDYVIYFNVDRNRIYKYMKIWENPNRREINLPHTDECVYVCGNYLIPPGTYDNKNDAIEFGKYTYDMEVFIDSYEIIDQERYDQLIEVL